jgi:PhnB protein
MKKLTPYLMFNGDCEKALNFYKDALDGKITYLGRYDESPLEVDNEFNDKIIHSELKWDGGAIMASDHLKGADFHTERSGSNVHLNLSFIDETEMMNVFNKLKAGGKVTMEIEKMFWGDKFGTLKDKFDIHWMFNCKCS